MRIIVSLQCSQLPIGNWLFDFIKLTENLWAEPQADRIVKPFHAVLINPVSVQHLHYWELVLRQIWWYFFYCE